MHRKINEAEIEVRFSEVDEMGIAHHSHYLVWCEIGRIHFIARALDIPFEEFKKHDIFLPVVKAYGKFYRPVGVGDIIVIRTFCWGPKASMIHFFYEIFKKETMVRTSTGLTVHILTNQQRKVMERFPPVLEDKIDEAVKRYPFCFLDFRQARLREKAIVG
jgi:acyl-CoA thioester hydrolase